MRARVDDCAVLLEVLRLTDIFDDGLTDAASVALLMDVPERTVRRALGRLTRAGVLREWRAAYGAMGAPRKVWEVVS
jgi:predicted ArsR family transcriptional regulator